MGGGPIFVPLFAALLSWSVKVAAGLSSAVITAGSLGGVAARLRARHPFEPSAPMVDYAKCLFLLGPMLTGVSFGVLLNMSMPAW